jgi:geranylgeranyl reductase family protein
MADKYKQCDVTIVGAGPAGAILAFELAQKGLRVLLLEKEILPRKKVCAGGITVRARTLLPFDIDEIVENVIYGVRLSYHRVIEKVRKYDQPLAYMVRREKFDQLLVTQACKAGALLEDGVEVQRVEPAGNHVIVKTSLNTFSTSILVGADGANSAVVRSLGWRKGFNYGLGVNGDITVDGDRLNEWNGLIGLDWGIPGGYAWIFPKQDCLAVGAGSSFRVARILKPYTMNMVNEFDLGKLKSGVIRGHLMPLRRAKTPLCYQRIILVGDAAGVIDPLTGEGIFYGLQSSYLAAAAILKFTQGQTLDLQEYNKSIDTDLMPELKIARTIQKLNSITPRIFYRYLKENDRFWRAFCRMLRGERTYQSLKRSLPAPLRLLFSLL